MKRYKDLMSNISSCSIQAMGDLAAEGGKIFWVAPSGGRDRPDPATGEYVVAPFDGKALDMFKLVCMQSRKVCKKHRRSMLFLCVQCMYS